MIPTIPLPIEKWSGRIRQVTLGATAAEGGTRAKTVTVGGQTTLPFLEFEGQIPHRPAIAIEVQDRPPEHGSALLEQAWGQVWGDAAAWAKAAESAGADLIALQFTLHDDLTPAYAQQTARNVLQATGLPLLVFGPGQPNLDNDLLVAVAEIARGELLVLGMAETDNYRTLVAAALAHGHLVNARTPMDVNLAKQLNILISDTGLPLERVLMDPTTGALGYGLEYGYSVIERLRLTALQGDSMTQLPILVTVGEEVWRTKETQSGVNVPPAWGELAERAINWEALTAASLIQAGADIVVLRHPESIKRVRGMIEALGK